MIDILKRLYRIARASSPKPEDLFKKLFKRSPLDQEEMFDDETYFEQQSETRNSDYSSSQDNTYTTNQSFHFSRQVTDDLAVFGLKPPSSFDEVRKARNREIKKFHSDRFINQPDKFQTSKEIMQIINAAYDRLETYYKNKQN